jgi:hypothetical protein
MFGWGTLATTLVIGLIQHQYGLSIRASEQAAWWLMPLLNALAALVVVAAFNALVLAPYRAWRMLKPFRIEVVSGQLDSEYPKEAFPRQSCCRRHEEFVVSAEVELRLARLADSWVRQPTSRIASVHIRVLSATR